MPKVKVFIQGADLQTRETEVDLPNTPPIEATTTPPNTEDQLAALADRITEIERRLAALEAKILGQT